AMPLYRYAPMPYAPRTSVQLEIHSQVEDDFNRLPSHRPRFEVPRLHGFLCFFAQAHRQSFEHVNLLDVSFFVDDRFDDDDAGDVRLARRFGVVGLRAIEHDRRLHVAADAHRSGRQLRLRVAAGARSFRARSCSADLSADGSSDDATFLAAELTANLAADFTTHRSTLHASHNSTDHASRLPPLSRSG